MIEDPDLTLCILRYFSREDVPNPANKLVEELADDEFRGVDLGRLRYHVRCAQENGLLAARISRVATSQAVQYSFGFIDGLTAKGGEYVRNSQTGFWDKAVKEIEDGGASVTTNLMVKFLPMLIEKSLGI